MRSGVKPGQMPMSEAWDGIAANRLPARAVPTIAPVAPIAASESAPAAAAAEPAQRVASTIAAEFPLVLDLTGLSASDGITIRGDAAGDLFGWSVSDAGDINGDGFGDVVVGAPFGNGGGAGAGEAYVLFGKASGLADIDVSNLTAAQGFVIQGDAAGDTLGRAVTGAGDVNGDGFDDIMLGAPSGDNGGNGAGEVYVIFGRAGPANIDLTSLTAAQGFIIQGDIAGDSAGFSVASAGDINGDGLDDMIVGATYGDKGGTNAGEAYVIFGKASGLANIDLTSLTAGQGFIIQGDANFDLAGWAVSSAGDINDDGFDDLIVGAPLGDNADPGAGEAYVLFGKASGFANIDLATPLTAAQGFVITGDPATFYSGVSAASVGDVNGDGFDDLAVGAPLDDTGGTASGETYVIFGKASGFGTISLANLAATAGFIIRGDAAGDDFGRSIDSAGDVNGDGFGDIIIGATKGDNGGTDAGEAYVIYGKNGGFGTIDLTDITPQQGFIIQGDAAGDNAGWSVSAAGDVNGDGLDDLIVGARYGDDGGASAGEAYIIFGRGEGGGGQPINRAGTGGDDTLAGGALNDTLSGLSGDDRLEGRAGMDSLLGGNGFDLLFGGLGNDILRGGAVGDTLVGGGGADSMFGDSSRDAASYQDASEGVRVDLGNTALNTGDAAGDSYDLIEDLIGSAFADTLTGNSRSNGLYGGAVADILSGGSGGDTLVGGAGRDTLAGGANSDQFRLDSLSPHDRETITDFSGGDAIALLGSVYGLDAGALAPSAFKIGNFATDGNDRIIYNEDTGALFFDADGSGAGVKIRIATLTNLPTLEASDFIVI